MVAPMRKDLRGAAAAGKKLLLPVGQIIKSGRPRHRHVQLWVLSAHRNKHARIYFASGPLEAIAVQRWFTKLHAEMISACKGSHQYHKCHSQCYRELQRGAPMVQPFTMGSTVLASPRYLGVRTRRVLAQDACDSEVLPCVLEATATFDIDVGETEIRYEVFGQLPIEDMAVMMPDPLGDQLCSQPSATFISSESSPKQLPRHKELPKSRLRPNMPSGVLRSTSAPASMRRRSPAGAATKSQESRQGCCHRAQLNLSVDQYTRRCDSHLSVVREVTVEDASLPSMDSDSNSTKSSSRTCKCSQKLIAGIADAHVQSPACQSEKDVDQPLSAPAVATCFQQDGVDSVALESPPVQLHAQASLGAIGGCAVGRGQHFTEASTPTEQPRACIATNAGSNAHRQEEMLGIYVARSFTCTSTRRGSRGKAGEHLRDSNRTSPSCAGGSSQSGRTESGSVSFPGKSSLVESYLPGVGRGDRIHDLSTGTPGTLELPPSIFYSTHAGNSFRPGGDPKRGNHKLPRERIPYGDNARRSHMNAATTGTALPRHRGREASAARRLSRGAKPSNEQRFKLGGEKARGSHRIYGSPTRGTAGRRRGRSRSLGTGAPQAARSLLPASTSSISGTIGTSGSGVQSDLGFQDRQLPSQPRGGHEADTSSTSNSSSIYFGATSLLASASSWSVSGGGGQFDRFVPVELILPPGGMEKKQAKRNGEHDAAWGETDSDDDSEEEYEEGGPAHRVDQSRYAAAHERPSRSSGDIGSGSDEREGEDSTDEFSAVLNPLFLIRTEGPVWGALMRRAGFVHGLRKLLGLRQLAVVRLGVVQ